MLAAVVILARGSAAAMSIALAAPILFVALTAAGYYWAFLPVIALAFVDQPRKIALLFGVEAASYTILLFEERDGLAGLGDGDGVRVEHLGKVEESAIP